MKCTNIKYERKFNLEKTISIELMLDEGDSAATALNSVKSFCEQSRSAINRTSYTVK